nr:hypothetical protein [Tanacetum cinerariifolium]
MFEMHITRQERLESLEQDFASYKSKMEADLRKYKFGARAIGDAPGIKSIWNSAWGTGGRPGKSSGKTSGNPLTTGRILSIEARDMDTKLLSTPESNNSLARCGFRRNVTSSGWPLFMQFLGKSFSIPIIFSKSGSISPEGFLPSNMLLAVIIVAVAIVVTVVLVVVDAIIGFEDNTYLLRAFSILSSDLVGLFYSYRLGVCIPPGQGVIGVSLGSVFLLVFLVFAMVVACVSRAAATLSTTNFLMAARVMAGAADVDVLLGGIIST